MEPMTLERAKELIKILIDDMSGVHLCGEPLDIEELINYLFTLDFTEEEMLELGICSEEDIDRANASIMSAPEQFEQ